MQRLINFAPRIRCEKRFSAITALPSANIDIGLMPIWSRDSQQLAAEMDVAAAAERTPLVSRLSRT